MMMSNEHGVCIGFVGAQRNVLSLQCIHIFIRTNMQLYDLCVYARRHLWTAIKAERRSRSMRDFSKDQPNNERLCKR